MAYRRLAVALIVVSVLSFRSVGEAEPHGSGASGFGQHISEQEAIYRSVGEKVPQGYTVDRSLLSYATTLSPEFRRELAALGPQDRWLDIGAGEGRAVVDYCTGQYDALLRAVGHKGEKAKAVAVSIEDRRTPRWHGATACLENGRIQYLFGKRLREYPDAELGRFQLMSDVLGAFSYTRYPSVFMGRALSLLTTGGSFHTLLQDVRAEHGGNKPFYPDASFLTEIRDASGAEVKVCEWLKRIECVQVTCSHTPNSTPPVEVYRIHKVCDRIVVPPLRLTHFESGTPPERRFRLK